MAQYVTCVIVASLHIGVRGGGHAGQGRGGGHGRGHRHTVHVHQGGARVYTVGGAIGHNSLRGLILVRGPALHLRSAVTGSSGSGGFCRGH